MGYKVKNLGRLGRRPLPLDAVERMQTLHPKLRQFLEFCQQLQKDQA